MNAPLRPIRMAERAVTFRAWRENREVVNCPALADADTFEQAIKPLSADVVQHPATDTPADPAAKWANTFMASVKAADSIEAIAALKAEHETKLAQMAEKRPELRAEVDRVVAECEAFLSSDAPADASDEDLGW